MTSGVYRVIPDIRVVHVADSNARTAVDTVHLTHKFARQSGVIGFRNYCRKRSSDLLMGTNSNVLSVNRPASGNIPTSFTGRAVAVPCGSPRTVGSYFRG